VSSPRKALVRSQTWIHPVFEQRIAMESDIDLAVCPLDASADEAFARLSRAHAFNVSPAKDELPKHLFVTPEFLTRCPDLLLISSSGAGYDTVDVPACTRAGVAVVNQAGGNAVSVAEMAIGLLLAVSRRIVECDKRMRRERGFPREELMGHEISGRTIGLVGIGHTGRRVAALAKAFDMTVLAHDPYLSPEEIAARGARSVSLDMLLLESDVVSLHCPRDPDTMGMMNAQAFGRMKRGAIFLSVARGGIHDEAALADALKSGHLAGAGLDVWHPEPPQLDSPLLAMDNVVATYHLAGVSHEARRNVASMAAEQIVATLGGGRPPRLVNPEVWPAYATRFERVFGRAPQA
jgi:D-3-phosphoglycerate dehydrogenase